MFTRTVQTLKNSTDLVQRFTMPNIRQTFELRRFSEKEKISNIYLFLKTLFSIKKIGMM